MSEIFSQTAW